jgi:glycosyltransferase involved in cell wall biosynthesis
MPELLPQAPANVQFVGHLDAARLAEFYRDLRMLVLPSKCFEAFPLVLVEAMLQRKPVICSNIGGLPEIVEDGVTGLLFQTGNAAELAEKVRSLWSRPDVCRRMGEAGRAKAVREYSAEKYYERLLAAYRQALTLGPGGPRPGKRMPCERRG